MPKKNPYNFDPTFERAVVFMCASRSRFYGRVGFKLDPEELGTPVAKLAMEAIRSVAKDLNRGPDKPSLVLQRLRRWMEDGRVSLEQIQGVADYFEDAEDAGVPDEESVVAEIVPVLRKRMNDEAVVLAMEEAKQRSDGAMSRTAALISEAARLGDTDTSVGVKVGAGSYEEIDKLRHLQRLPTGIMELDDALNGGMRRGGLGILVGGSGDGKSMGLSHIAAHSMFQGLFVLYATLELGIADVLARIKANLTGIPIDAILEDPERAKGALSMVRLGPCIAQHFTPHAATMEDIEAWVASAEEVEGRAVDVLVTDYGDKLVMPKGAKGGSKEESSYTTARVVFERMRIYADERAKGKIWHWTASQATRGRDKRKVLGLDDVADSMHKVRVADLVVTLNAQEDEQMLFGIGKNRHGKGKTVVGPVPTDFACGRIAPVNYPLSVAMGGAA